MAPPPAGDPFVYRPGHDASLIARAIAGEGQALFTASPGGAAATAARVARLRPLINAAVAGSGIDPDLLEGLVFVESAGRPDVVAGGDPASAAGLTQILPATGSTMLGLHVDLAKSRALTQAIAGARAGGASATVIAGLAAAPGGGRSALRSRPCAGRDGALPRARPLAFRAPGPGVRLLPHGHGQPLAACSTPTTAGAPVPYVQLFFDTAPDRHGAAYALLSGFSDQSWLYYWRVLGAASLMRLYRSSTRAPSPAWPRCRPRWAPRRRSCIRPTSTPALADPRALADAYASGALRPLPGQRRAARAALRQLDRRRCALACTPRPACIAGSPPRRSALLLELAARVRTLSHGQAPLVVTSAVSDTRYQRLLGTADPPAAAGWSFTLARTYVGGAQANALQAMLDRLQALNLIAWARYPGEIEVTVASDAARVIAHGP